MTGPVEEDCPVGNSSKSAKERFAIAKVAEHVEKNARHDEAHQWVDAHTTNGTLAESTT